LEIFERNEIYILYALPPPVQKTIPLHFGVNTVQSLHCGVNTVESLHCGVNTVESLHCGVNFYVYAYATQKKFNRVQFIKNELTVFCSKM